jgi:hypothetical protein
MDKSKVAKTKYKYVGQEKTLVDSGYATQSFLRKG